MPEDPTPQEATVTAKIPRSTLLWILGIMVGGTALTSGGTNVIQSIALRAQPVPVEVTSPQMQAVVERNLAPVKEMIADHAAEFTHPPAIREFEDIDKGFIRQDRRMDKIETNLAETTETLNRLAGQVEILVQMQSGFLGVR